MNDIIEMNVSKNAFFETDEHQELRDLLLEFWPQAIDDNLCDTISIDRTPLICYEHPWIDALYEDRLFVTAYSEHGVKVFNTEYHFTPESWDLPTIVFELYQVIDRDGSVIFNHVQPEELYTEIHPDPVMHFIRSYILQKKLEKSFTLPNIDSTLSPRPRL